MVLIVFYQYQFFFIIFINLENFLDKADYRVALIMNVDSKKNGKKDMIKIENVINYGHGDLGLIDKD